jgi:hypothetical protein
VIVVFIWNFAPFEKANARLPASKDQRQLALEFCTRIFAISSALAHIPKKLASNHKS